MSLFRNSVEQNAASDQTAAGDDEESEPPLFESVHQSLIPSRVSVDVTTAAISLSPPLPRRTDYGSLPDYNRVLPRTPPHNVSHTNAIQVVTIEWRCDDWCAWAVCLASDGCHVGHSGLRLRPAAGPCDYLPALDHFLRHLQWEFPDEPCGRRGEGRLRAQQSAFRVQLEHCGALSRACLLGPFLVERLGCLLTLLAGMALFVGGALLPALWPALSLWLWWLCFGLANGTGNAVVYVASQAALEQSFERRFGTAASIASLGMALANVLLP